MLYRLEIENFYSVYEPQVIDLRIGKGVPDAPGRFDVLFPGCEERASRVMAVFGPNASGKSTILKALAFVGWFVHGSFQLAPEANLPCERFNEERQKKPIRLAIEFGGPLDITTTEVTPYATWRYELVISTDDRGRNIVFSESLKQRPDGKGRWVRVFDRERDEIQSSKTFSLKGYNRVIDKVRDNASLISTLAQFDHPASLRLRAAAQRIVGNIFIDRNEISDGDAIKYYASNSLAVDALNAEIQRIDLGVRRMDMKSLPTGPMAYFEHEGLHAPMPWSLESHGTRSFIKNFPWLYLALQNGGVALIDEIDISIHPLVLPEIIRWFYDDKRNLRKAQLWVTCHAASLLEDLLKEEVFFCEKNIKGQTRVYGMQDIENVRRTDNRYRKYLSGSYGAVPQIG
jgi:AAA15 family ATPase/GTPase